MKSKTIIITALIVILLAAAFYSYRVYHRKKLRESFGHGTLAGQSNRIGNREDEIPQSGNLCSGTGGNGQIVNVGNNIITMKRKDDGRNQSIHLTDQKTIKTSTGSGSLSDLKTGEKITLVGGPNPDGSFTANTVVVCN